MDNHGQSMITHVSVLICFGSTPRAAATAAVALLPRPECLRSPAGGARTLAASGNGACSQKLGREVLATLAGAWYILIWLDSSQAMTGRFFVGHGLVQVWKYNSFEYSDDPVASAIYLQASFHSHDPWPKTLGSFGSQCGIQKHGTAWPQDCNPNANWVADDGCLTLRARLFIPESRLGIVFSIRNGSRFQRLKPNRWWEPAGYKSRVTVTICNLQTA